MTWHDIMSMVIKMNIHALLHQAKSEFSYAYDANTLHLIFRTAKNDFDSVSLIYGDPFHWVKLKEGEMTWKHDQKPMIKRYTNDLFDYYFIAIEPSFYRTKYAFTLMKDHHVFLYGTKQLKQIEKEEDLYSLYDLSEYFNFPYLNQEDLHHTPSWVKDTIWYQIFPDRFYSTSPNPDLKWGKLPVNNHELYGGNIKGITEKLPYLQSLGITGIYFTPMFESPTAHKYDTTDYFKIDPQFGTNADFGVMVQRAHELGIKVMLDGVFNHAGYDHPFFQDVIKHGESSPYKDCFFIDQYPVINFPLNPSTGKPIKHQGTELNYRTFAFTPMMPKWNTSNPITEKHLLDCIRYWIETYDIDGWRLDVSNEISHEFLRKIRETARKAKKDTFILGENWDSSIPWLHGDQLDSVMNYDLSYPIWKFLEHKMNLSTFKHVVSTYMAHTPKNVMENMFNLVGSHDTIRIKRRLKDDERRVKLAYLLMFIAAGAPNIYYGDEIGMTGEHDPDNRRCMIWNEGIETNHFYQFTKQLIHLRKTNQSMSSHDFHLIESNCLIISKDSGVDDILLIINNSDQKTICDTSLVVGNYIDCFTSQSLVIHGKITLEAYGYVLLQKV
jgi:cyclomaltodextrinase / maltogenic alpha-amylase / neopullulanase